MFGITLEWSVSVGQLIQLAIFLIGGFAIIVTMRGDIKSLKSAVTAMQTEITKITDILVQLGRQDERLDGQDRRINNLDARVSAHANVLMKLSQGNE